MRIQLLGTGASSGWPNPWCSCASCAWARAAGAVRGQTAALVDGVLLLDCGPDVPRSAARHGVALDGVRHLLLGHAHPDHAHGEALMWREWSTAAAVPLDVVAPPAAAAVCRPWAGPAVTFREVGDGDRVTAGPYDVRVLPAAHGDASVGPAVLYDVTGPDGTRLLYAVDTGPLPTATLDRLGGAAYDVVLLEETDGDGPPSGDHHGLASFGTTVAALRRNGAVRTGADVVAVHLGHGNPPGDELGRRLALLGARTLPDGAVIRTGVPAVRDPAPRRVLVLGGARSGKSAEAERRLASEPEVVYVATAGPPPPGDDEWAARIDVHRARRPPHWRTVETTDLVPLLAEPGPPLLIDSLGLWVAAHLDDPPGDALVAAWRDTRRRVVAVAEDVGSGVVPATASGRRFRDEVGRLSARLAAQSDEVWQVVAGIARRIR